MWDIYEQSTCISTPLNSKSLVTFSRTQARTGTHACSGSWCDTYISIIHLKDGTALCSTPMWDIYELSTSTSTPRNPKSPATFSHTQARTQAHAVVLGVIHKYTLFTWRMAWHYVVPLCGIFMSYLLVFLSWGSALSDSPAWRLAVTKRVRTGLPPHLVSRHESFAEIPPREPSKPFDVPASALKYGAPVQKPNTY